MLLLYSCGCGMVCCTAVWCAVLCCGVLCEGQLAGTDTRWDVISQSVDDRTDRERGLDQSTASSSSSVEGFQPELVAGGVKRLSKSRYSSVSCFIGKAEGEEELKNLEALNDMDPNMDAEAFDMLLKGGLDRSLAAHIAHLFVRDPLVIFDDAVVLDDRKAMVSRSDSVIWMLL
jgi:glutamate--cysteine ligase catalytic subunit